MENGKESHHSMPLVSRLDHLEAIMKNLEGKQNLAKWSSNNAFQGVERHYKPLNLAVREAYFKGSLLDRVVSLENRLFQLCSELKSSIPSCTTGTSGDASSSLQESKRGIFCSLPTFKKPHQGHNEEHQALINSSEIQEKSSKLQVEQPRRKQQQTSSSAKKQGKSKPRAEKACKREKKRVLNNWPHLKMLGC